MHPADTVALFARRFDSIGLPYMLVGSVAAAFWGRDRQSRDIDFVADLRARPAVIISGVLEPEYGLDQVTVEESARRGAGMVNALPLSGPGWKVDSNPLTRDAFDQYAFHRRLKEDWRGTPVSIIRPSDLVISKLRWAKDSSSERQLADVGAILALGIVDEDEAEFVQWIARLGLEDLISTAKASRYDE